MGMALAICVCVSVLGGSGGMLPQEFFGVLDPQRAFLVHSGGISEAIEV